MKLSLRSRIYLGILPLLLLVLGLMLYLVLHVRDKFDESKEIADTNISIIQQLSSIQHNLVELETILRISEPELSSGKRRASIKEASDSVRNVAARIDPDALNRKLSSTDEGAVRFIEDLMTFSEAVEEQLTADASGRESQLRDQVIVLESRTEEMQKAAQRHLRALQDRIATHAQIVYSTIVACVIGAIVLTLFGSLLLWRRIIKPIEQLHRGIRAAGGAAQPVKIDYHRKDELGDLARNLENTTSRLVDYQELTSEKLMRSTSAMRSILDQSPDAFFIFSDSHSPTYLSPSASKLYSQSNLRNQLPAEITARFEKTLQTGESYLSRDINDAVRITVDGEDRWYLIHTFPFDAPDSRDFNYERVQNVLSIAAIFQDATVLRLSYSVRKDLLATVSHELKTPITSVRMALYLLLDQNVGPLNEMQKELLETARDDVNRQLSTIEHLLDLSRIEDTLGKLDESSVNIGQIISESIDAHTELALASDSVLRQQHSDENIVVTGDSEKLRIALNNLILNAIKYAGPGSEVVVRAERKGSICRVEVADNGPGIDSRFVDQIFGAYTRGADTLSVKGSGLGLKISKDMIEAHDGTIGCESTLGEGSIFFFEIPVDH